MINSCKKLYHRGHRGKTGVLLVFLLSFSVISVPSVVNRFYSYCVHRIVPAPSPINTQPDGSVSVRFGVRVMLGVGVGLSVAVTVGVWVGASLWKTSHTL